MCEKFFVLLILVTASSTTACPAAGSVAPSRAREALLPTVASAPCALAPAGAPLPAGQV